ncbi:helix-turn-helix transcriptional regulator [Adlercreutzia sp. R25]|uniref:Helix-turn-helix transcriptional regulator n=1 Tax=Adlercreutzia shanghongiae TaxID=3111773 RepID=A0ABU6J144_9ACTN|nr:MULTISPECIES: helix-turn-helix transcriptional regulator [unclassified Adlercreutzia]MEC4273410.1 helix-turn-helix transcriptional regulator [Adlercreutzia sp. R25]MEC4295552.1 helix-turn-helix transcriptional regulator [Adlercreutzia sp. R22]
MGLAIFYETLLVILVSALTAAVCLSSYLVTKRKTMLYACVAFLFYFFDVASILQDDYAAHTFTAGLSWEYYFLRSFYTMATGAGFLGAFWYMVCEYIGERRRVMRTVPLVAYVAISLLLLAVSGESKMLRFCYYSCRAAFMFWILLYGGAHFLRTRDEVERQRLGRYKVHCIALALLGVVMVAEDALFFLVLSTDTIALGPVTLTAERNYAENLLMMVCAAMTCWFALRQLSIHSSKSPVIDDTQRYRQTAEDLLVYAKRHQLTAREQEVLDYILRDHDNQNIASAMSLAPSTVKVHVHNILQKTGHANRQELIQDFWKTV